MSNESICTLKMIYLLSLILFSLPANAIEPNCDDRNNLSQQSLNYCSYKDSLESKKRLSNVLEPQTLEEWSKVSGQVCREAWKGFKEGSIYSLKVNQCQRNMDDYLFYSNQGGMKGMYKKYELN